MKYIKYGLSFLLFLGLGVGMVACGGEKQKNPSTDLPSSQSSHSTQQTTDSDSALPLPPPVTYDNPLTGLAVTVDNAGNRPVAVMVNNLKQALPQEGIAAADIMVECRVEGGITRLMCLYSDYQSLGVVGSVRSSRPCFLDFAQAFDAIYCHSGGSDEAYSQISARKINNIDGVKKDPLDVYYRDEERLQTMALEHTLMTTGEGITKTIAHYKYRTTLREGFALPFEFASEEAPVSVGEDDARHVYLPISGYQEVDYVYDAQAKTYLRYQHDGQKHVDGKTGTQLSFKNIIVLFCNTTVVDDVGHLNITTTGSGKGYLISEGKAVAITWSRTHRDGNLTLKLADTGSPVIINAGKTVINVCTTSTYGAVQLNAADRTVQN